MAEHDAKDLYDRAKGDYNPQSPIIHIRVMGRSRDIALDMLNLTTNSNDQAIREAVARFMELSVQQLQRSIIERHENGNMTLRPEAVFG